MNSRIIAGRRRAIAVGMAVLAIGLCVSGARAQEQSRALRPVEVLEKRALLIGNARYPITSCRWAHDVRLMPPKYVKPFVKREKEVAPAHRKPVLGNSPSRSVESCGPRRADPIVARSQHGSTQRANIFAQTNLRRVGCCRQLGSEPYICL